MSYPVLISTIINFMKDEQRSSSDFLHGFSLLSLLVALNLSQVMANSHTAYNNILTGNYAQKVMDTLTIEKSMRLTAAMGRNYDVG